MAATIGSFVEIQNLTMRIADGSWRQVERTIQEVPESNTVVVTDRCEGSSIPMAPICYSAADYLDRLNIRELYKRPSIPFVKNLVRTLEDPDFEGNMIEAIQKAAQEMVKSRFFFAPWEAERAIQIEHLRVLETLDKDVLKKRIENVTKDWRKNERIVERQLKKQLTLVDRHQKLETAISDVVKREKELGRLVNDRRSSFLRRVIDLGLVENFRNEAAIESLQKEAIRHPGGHLSDLFNEYQNLQSLTQIHGALREQRDMFNEEMRDLTTLMIRDRKHFGLFKLCNPEAGTRVSVHQDNLATKTYLHHLDLAGRRKSVWDNGSIMETSGELCDEISQARPGADFRTSPLLYAKRCVNIRLRLIFDKERAEATTSHRPLSYAGVYALIKTDPRGCKSSSLEEWEQLEDEIQFLRTARSPSSSISSSDPSV